MKGEGENSYLQCQLVSLFFVFFCYEGENKSKRASTRAYSGCRRVTEVRFIGERMREYVREYGQ